MKHYLIHGKNYQNNNYIETGGTHTLKFLGVDFTTQESAAKSDILFSTILTGVTVSPPVTTN